MNIKTILKTLGMIVGGCVLLVVIVLLTGNTSGKPAEQKPATDQIAVMGDTLVMDQDLVLVSNREDFEEFTKARRAEDQYGLTLMLAQKKLFIVNKGETVQVINMYSPLSEVRVIEGEYAGRSGWNYLDYFKKD